MIRPMEPRDKEPVLGLIRATNMFTAAEIAVAEELIDIYLGKSGQNDYRVVVIENDRKDAVGYMTWGPTPVAEDAYDIYWMAVSPAEQGRGRGKALVGRARGRGPPARRPDDHHRNVVATEVQWHPAVLHRSGL